MTEDAVERAPSRIGRLDVLLSLVAATGFAVAQPFYDLLGENAEFFLVRSSPGSDVVLFVLGLSIGLPLALAALILTVTTVHAGAGRGLHLTALTLLGALFLLPIVQRVPAIDRRPGVLVLTVVIIAGASGAWLFLRHQTVRIVLRFGSVGALLFAVMFVFTSPSSSIVFTSAAQDPLDGGSVRAPAPIVMVVFDEFPLASLLDEDATIDENHYPGFAALGRDATWFRNAVTPHDFTTWAVPGMLTGIRPPDEWRPPTIRTHPNNLFTLLADTYDMRVFEAVTRLCPVRACAESKAPPPQPSFGARWRSLLSDLRIVSGHLYLPETYRRHLPPIDETVGDFATDTTEDADHRDQEPAQQRPGAGELISDRLSLERSFLASIEQSEQPRLHFVHLFIPHRPWELLPSGQRYREVVPPAKQGRGWRNDGWLVAQAYQQHLLQVAYADRFVSRLVATLKERGMYDETMIVLVADHGIAFEPGAKRHRFVTESTIGEIAAVPLIVKLPGQRGGGVVDRRVETLDIVPTIAEAIQTRIPWEVSGGSLFDEGRRVRRTRICSASKECLMFGIGTDELLAAARRKIQLFPGGDPYALAPSGYHNLLGRSLDRLRVTQSSQPVRLTRRSLYEDVRPNARVLPVALSGVIPGASRDRHQVLAIGVNGRIVAVTRTYLPDEGEVSFLAMLPPDSLIRGGNDVRVFVVEGSGSARVLATMPIS